jgi:cytochrome c556
MTKTRCALGVVLVLGMLVGSNMAAARDDKTPSISEIMKKANAPKGSLVSDLRSALNSSSPNWETIGKESKELVTFAEALTKNEAPKGSKMSWEKLTKAYLKNAKDLASAAESMDLAKAKAAHKAISGSCSACHTAHKG